jgi:hypothetical protein
MSGPACSVIGRCGKERLIDEGIRRKNLPNPLALRTPGDAPIA